MKATLNTKKMQASSRGIPRCTDAGQTRYQLITIFVLRFGTSLLIPIAGDLEDQLSPHVASLNHPMRPDGVLQWEHFDRRYADRSSINQIGNLPHRVPSSLKVDNKSDLAEASTLGFLAIALNIAVCGDCEDADQPAAVQKHMQRMRQGGRPYDVQNDINALSRPVTNRPAYV